MKLINPSVEIYSQPHTLEEVKNIVDNVNKTCYNANEYTYNLCLEHGTVYLSIPCINKITISLYNQSNSSFVSYIGGRDVSVTTNLLEIYKKHWINDLNFISGPTNNHFKKITVNITCSRYVSEILSNNFLVKTLFIITKQNFIDDKNNYLTFINTYNNKEYNEILTKSEQLYFSLLKKDKYSNAVSVLPLSIKTSLVLTGLENDWKQLITNFKKNIYCEELKYIVNQIDYKLNNK